MMIKTRREFHSRSARNNRHKIEQPEHSEELNASLGGESKQKWNTKTTQKTRHIKTKREWMMISEELMR